MHPSTLKIDILDIIIDTYYKNTKKTNIKVLKGTIINQKKETRKSIRKRGKQLRIKIKIKKINNPLK